MSALNETRKYDVHRLRPSHWTGEEWVFDSGPFPGAVIALVLKQRRLENPGARYVAWCGDGSGYLDEAN